MTPETSSLIGGLTLTVVFFSFFARKVQALIAHWLRDVPQVVVGLLGGLMSALYCVHTTLTIGWEWTIWRFLVEWPPFPFLCCAILACISAPGRPMREGRATVPVFAMAGAYEPTKPSRYNRFVGWLQVPWHRVVFRGAMIIGFGTAVLIVRGDLRSVRVMIMVFAWCGLRAMSTAIAPDDPTDGLD